MKNVCYTLKRFFYGAVLAAGSVLLIAGTVACNEEKAPDVPREQSDLLFDTFRDLEQKKYESALPKLKRYQELDGANTAEINNMINLTTTNIFVVQLKALLEQGKFAEAQALMENMLKQHATLDYRVRLKDFATRLNKIDLMIRKLAPVQNSAFLRKHAESLEREAKNLPGTQKVEAYAKRKKTEADELEKIEQDRFRIWPWLDALEAKNSNDKERAELLRIYVAALYEGGFGEPIVRELAPENQYSMSK